jgi:cold shock CspA family protein
MADKLAPSPSGPPVRAVVKWSNPEKGFGFAELSDGFGDAFLHESVLAQRSIDAVQSGDTLEVRVGPGHKGPQVTEVLSVDANTAAPFNEIAARYLKAVGDPREVVSDPEARYFGGRVEERSLVPLGEARLGGIGFDEWLRRSQTGA